MESSRAILIVVILGRCKKPSLSLILNVKKNMNIISVNGIEYKRLDFQNEMTIRQFENLLETVREVADLLTGNVAAERYVIELVDAVLQKQVHKRLLSQLYFNSDGVSLSQDFEDVKFSEVLNALTDFFTSIMKFITGDSRIYSAKNLPL